MTHVKTCLRYARTFRGIPGDACAHYVSARQYLDREPAPEESILENPSSNCYEHWCGRSKTSRSPRAAETPLEANWKLLVHHPRMVGGPVPTLGYRVCFVRSLWLPENGVNPCSRPTRPSKRKLFLTPLFDKLVVDSNTRHVPRQYRIPETGLRSIVPIAAISPRTLL